MSKSQRTKGAAGEREWCAVLKAHGFQEPKRLLGQARDGGGDVPTPPLLWEVKRRARIAVYEFMAQAVAGLAAQPKCSLPAVALRADGKDWLVLMRAEDVLPVIRMALGLRCAASYKRRDLEVDRCA